jgi:hypothetical protein
MGMMVKPGSGNVHVWGSLCVATALNCIMTQGRWFRIAHTYKDIVLTYRNVIPLVFYENQHTCLGSDAYLGFLSLSTDGFAVVESSMPLSTLSI